MKTRHLIMILAGTLAVGCAVAPVMKSVDGTAYYFGPVRYFSADGRIPYGGTESAVKREIAGGGGLIIETVTQPGHSPSMPAQTFITRMARRGETLIHDASDEGKTFTGTLAFNGPELSAWTYDIKLVSGGTITGAGELTEKGIGTGKKLGGERPMYIMEELRPVSKEIYEQKISEMRPPSGAD